ncbi:MAG: SPOR domain-containing protein [Gammaproteobacteria bacterium]|nr:SPOR domain-containing protein [Gammaproteobacteria bacterium]
MNKNKSTENFDDIDQLATSLQEKIKQLNNDSSERSGEKSYQENATGDEITLQGYKENSIREQLTESFKEPEKNKNSKIKTSFLIGLLATTLVAIVILSAILFFPSKDKEISKINEVELTLPLPETTDVKNYVVSQQKNLVPENNLNIKEKDLFVVDTDENKVKKIPLEIVDEPDLIEVNKTQLNNEVLSNKTVTQNTKELDSDLDPNIIKTEEKPEQVRKIESKALSKINKESLILDKSNIEISKPTDLGLNFKHENYSKLDKDNGLPKVNENLEKQVMQESKSSNMPVDSTLLTNLKEIVPSDSLISEPIMAKENLFKITPDVLIADNKVRTIILSGVNFTDTTKIKVNWLENNKTKSKIFSLHNTPNQFIKVSDKEIHISINTGKTGGQWTISLTSGIDETSIILNVYPPYIEKSKSSDFKQIDKKSDKVEVLNKNDELHSNTAILTKPENYTIQLLSASNLSSLKRVISRYPDVKPLSWVKTNSNGKIWYRLIYGSFNSKKQAKNSYKKLPSKLKTKGYWIRKIKDLIYEPTVGTVSINKDKNINFKQVTGKKLLKLLSIPPQNWTLELITFSSKEKLNDFIKINKLEKNTNYYKRVSNGKTRYTLIYGSYDTKKNAINALNNLPKQIKISKPWLKKYSDIQWEIKNSRYYQ